jgi:predicted TIM-barrel fold metal-dependent hydrolase
MRTIAIEERFLARGFREVLQSNASSLAGVLNPMMTVERQTKLSDLDTLRLQDMDTGGIDLQVISDIGAAVAPRPGDEGVKLAREANDQLAQACATHPDRFAGFATLPMTKPEAAAGELERAVRSLGLKGPMLFGTMNGRFLDDPAFLPVLERAAALSVPIYLHPAEPPAPVREAYYTALDPAVGMVVKSVKSEQVLGPRVSSLRLLPTGQPKGVMLSHRNIFGKK